MNKPAQQEMVANTRRFYFDIFLIIIVALCLRILPQFFGCESMDIALYRQQAEPILQNLNIYRETSKVFPYSPLSMWLPALCLFLSGKFNLPFYVVMKIPAILGDILLAISIYYWLLRFNKGRKAAFVAGMLYAVNPMAILISAFQGNFMSIPTLFAFLAVMTMISDPGNNYRLSALLLGLGIGFRSYPILLLPLIFLKSKISLFKKIAYLGYAVLPTLILFIPFLLLDAKSVFREAFGYSGVDDFGLAAIIWNLTFLINNELFRNISDKIYFFLTLYSKLAFVFVYSVILLTRNSLNLLELILLIFIIFYAFYTGISAQYLIWIIPFLYFLKDEISKWYTTLGAYAIISFYVSHLPAIIFGRLDISLTNHWRGLLLNLIVAQSLFWILCAIWFFRLLFKKDDKEARLGLAQKNI